jgi:hypothetical protein
VQHLLREFGRGEFAGIPSAGRGEQMDRYHGNVNIEPLIPLC